MDNIICKETYIYTLNKISGPEQWCCLHKCWATCGSTRRQSPINLDTSEARRTNANLKLYNIDKRVPATIHNSGKCMPFTSPSAKCFKLSMKNGS